MDRYTILMLKVTRLTEGAPHKEIIEVNNALSELEVDQRYIERLFKVNRSIWDLEADIRQGKEGQLGLEEVGRRALKIRDLNAKRVAIKNEVNELYGGHLEVKVDHAAA